MQRADFRDFKTLELMIFREGLVQKMADVLFFFLGVKANDSHLPVLSSNVYNRANCGR